MQKSHHNFARRALHIRDFIIVPLALLFSNTLAQTDSLKAIEDIHVFQKELNESYKNRDESPLDAKDFKRFKGHVFFPIDLAYRVHARLIETPGTPILHLKTSTARLTNDRIYGYLEFVLKGKSFRLPVYQSPDVTSKAEYADYLFFPFTDLTNGQQTYGNGRYIDLRLPKDGNDIIVDFNKAYNPYCAYSHRFSCPIVPLENQMDIEIPVGIMYNQKRHP